MAEKFGFYDHCLFHTTVEETTWDEASGRWTVDTDRGDAMRARFVILANGILTTPKLARIEGMETFKGESFHTSRWNYNVDLRRQAGRHHRHRRDRRAGDPRARQDRRGALRVPAHAVHRSTCATSARRPTRSAQTWANEPGWARARRARFAKISAGRTAIQANDDYLAGKIADFKERKKHERELTPGGADPEAARRQLPHHGADPRARRRDRQGPEDGGGAEALLPVWLQAADLPRRVPADVQPAARPPGRHRADAA